MSDARERATDEELLRIHRESGWSPWRSVQGGRAKNQSDVAALRAVYNAGLTRAAEIARTFIPDPHDEHEACDDCAMTRTLAAAIEAEKGQS